MPYPHYDYVGPVDVRELSLAGSPPGTTIRSTSDLVRWIESHAESAAPDGSLTATFTIGVDGIMALAPQRSEHVACASGGPVLSAGEIRFAQEHDVCSITNQSTGFCPPPESWPAVAAALDHIGIARPDGFTTEIIFRFCPTCTERNIVKDQWFVCDMCGADLTA